MPNVNLGMGRNHLQLCPLGLGLKAQSHGPPGSVPLCWASKSVNQEQDTTPISSTTPA